MKQLIGFLLCFLLPGCACTVIEPGHRGVLVSWGEVDKTTYEGTVWHQFFKTSIHEISIRQTTAPMDASCFSSDTQTVMAKLSVVYQIPSGSVIKTFEEYHGDPFASFIAPKIQEAIKEVTQAYTAEEIVKKREEIKAKTLDKAKMKVGEIFMVHDIIIENIDLSDQLEQAIEAKMVEEQEAKKAIFKKQRAETERLTKVIEAEGDADAIRKRGEAIRQNPQIIDLEIAKKWNGTAPLVVGQGKGSDIILPLK